VAAGTFPAFAESDTEIDVAVSDDTYAQETMISEDEEPSDDAESAQEIADEDITGNEQTIIVQDDVDEETEEEVEIQTEDAYAVNPVYSHVIKKSHLNKPKKPNRTSSNGKRISIASTTTYTDDMDAVVEQIRTGMRDHDESIQLLVAIQDFDVDNWFSQLGEWISQAMEETDNPLEGDYIRWSYAGYSSNLSYIPNSKTGITKCTYTLTFTYYTTESQEESLSQAVDSALDSLGFTSSTSDYAKVKAIYDYICRHVTYDSTSSDSNLLKYTAYAAMINGTSVCQGYATLFYRMLRQEGIDNRIIASSTHAWNIVELQGLYYNADTTWDSYTPDNWRYFLLGEENDSFFDTDSHTRSNGNDFVDANGAHMDTPLALDYTSSAFYEAYPMSELDYSSVIWMVGGTLSEAHTHTYVTEITKASPTKTGKLEEYCKDCGTYREREEIASPKTVQLSSTSYTYDGTEKKPTVTVKDAEGEVIPSSNYSVAYSAGRKDAGTYKVTLTFKGDLYTGSLNTTYKINAKSISGMTGTLSTTSYPYDGTAKKPSVTVKTGSKTLVNGTDYTVSYSSNTNVGTAKVVITGKGNYTGTLVKSFTIQAKSIADLSATLSATSYTYDGKAKKPTVTLKSGSKTLANGTDYTVSYSSNTKVGKATVKLTGKGSYTGTKTLTFSINPKPVKLSSVKTASKAFTAKWAKMTTQTTGYQIQYSTSSQFTNAKTVTVTSNKTVSKKISKLTAKKKYYVRVCTYKTVNGVKYCSAWSAAKNVTTKK
jgi:hypothetical protein